MGSLSLRNMTALSHFSLFGNWGVMPCQIHEAYSCSTYIYYIYRYRTRLGASHEREIRVFPVMKYRIFNAILYFPEKQTLLSIQYECWYGRKFTYTDYLFVLCIELQLCPSELSLLESLNHYQSAYKGNWIDERN